MTALGAPALNTDRVRRTYRAVLGEVRLGAPSLACDEQRAHLAGLLRGHMRLLLPVVEERLPGMAGPFNRSTARHVIAAARTALDAPISGAMPAESVLDLAVLSRALLALHEHTA